MTSSFTRKNNIFPVSKLGFDFCLSKQRFPSIKKCKFGKKHFFNYDFIMMFRIPCDTHLEMKINRAKFDVCIPKSFGEFETDEQT